MKVWITSRALSLGIEECEASPSTYDGLINFMRPGYKYATYALGRNKNWHETRESAVVKAESMRVKKIASMRKQLEILEAKRFE